jgi:hypothetical protein
MNIFGKALLGNYPSHVAPPLKVLAWKSSENARWAYENLWNSVNKDGSNTSDTYIRRITKEVLKSNERTSNNCLFIVAIVDLMFDLNVQSTILSSEKIAEHMAEKVNANEQDVELQRKSNELDGEEVEDENTEDVDADDVDAEDIDAN